MKKRATIQHTDPINLIDLEESAPASGQQSPITIDLVGDEEKPTRKRKRQVVTTQSNGPVINLQQKLQAMIPLTQVATVPYSPGEDLSFCIIDTEQAQQIREIDVPTRHKIGLGMLEKVNENTYWIHIDYPVYENWLNSAPKFAATPSSNRSEESRSKQPKLDSVAPRNDLYSFCIEHLPIQAANSFRSHSYTVDKKIGEYIYSLHPTVKAEIGIANVYSKKEKNEFCIQIWIATYGNWLEQQQRETMSLSMPIRPAQPINPNQLITRREPPASLPTPTTYYWQPMLVFPSNMLPQMLMQSSSPYSFFSQPQLVEKKQEIDLTIFDDPLVDLSNG